MPYHAVNPDKLVKLDGDTLKFEDKGVFAMKTLESKKMLNGLTKTLLGKVQKQKNEYEKLAALDKNKPIVRQLVKDRLKHMGLNPNGVDDEGAFSKLTNSL